MSKQAASNGNQPVHTVRHRRIKATIWRNETAKGPMYNVTVTRSYQDEQGWHDSNSFAYDDLMNVAKLMYDAHGIISELRAKERVSSSKPRRSATSISSTKKGGIGVPV